MFKLIIFLHFSYYALSSPSSIVEADVAVVVQLLQCLLIDRENSVAAAAERFVMAKFQIVDRNRSVS